MTRQTLPVARGTLRLVPAEPRSASTERLEDEALIEAIERGDRLLGEQIYGRLLRVVETTLFRVLGRRDSDFEDLVQVAFEHIVTTISRRKFAKACSLTSWGAAVTCNVALNALRSRRSERKFIDRSADADATSPRVMSSHDLERQVEARLLLDRVRYHLGQMSGPRAEALLLHDMLGKELPEIAVLTGVSIAAAQSRLVRGRRELQRRLEDEGAMLSVEDA